MERITLENLESFARSVLERLSPSKRAVLITLEGNLGAGKTTFVQALACALGIRENVQSPTYVLMKKYDIPSGRFKQLVHIDAYRLETPAEFAALRPKTFMHDPNVLVCVEWPEKAVGQLPEPDRRLRFSFEPEAGSAQNDGRYIEVV